MGTLQPRCPRCEDFLSIISHAPAHYSCRKCKGTFHSFSRLEDIIQESFIKRVSEIIENNLQQESNLICIKCDQKMALVRPFHHYKRFEEFGVIPKADPEFMRKYSKLEIDVCKTCFSFWFDKNELNQIPATENKYDEKEVADTEDPILKYLINIPFVEGIKNKDADSPLLSATNIIGLTCILSSLWCFNHLDMMIISILDSENILFYGGINLITSLFIHANWFHLIGNMTFFFTFSKPVEQKIGFKKFLILFFASGVVSGIHQSLKMKHGVSLGASGAISGVMVYFALSFPKANVSQWLHIRTGLGMFNYKTFKMTIPALIFISAWFFEQYAYATFLKNNSDIGYWAHISGALTGMVLFFLNSNEQ